MFNISDPDRYLDPDYHERSHDGLSFWEIAQLVPSIRCWIKMLAPVSLLVALVKFLGLAGDLKRLFDLMADLQKTLP